MANALTPVIPTLFSQGLMALRSTCVMPRLVNTDFGSEVRKKGDTIQVPLPSSMAVTDVVPGNVAPNPQDVAPVTTPIPLNYWKEAPFVLSEKELAQVIDGVVPMQLSAAVQALAAYINGTILGLYTGVYGYVGTAGTTPFASDFTAITSARKVLANQFAPLNDRYVVINPDAEANALSLPAFYAALNSGTTETIRNGQIGQKLGFDWNMDQQVPTQVTGTLTGTVTCNGVQAIGAGATGAGRYGTLSVATAAGAAFAPNVGDVFTRAGDSQTYTIVSGAALGASTSGTFTISPALKVATAGGEAITLKASHVANLAFQRNAFAFASRPLMSEDLTANQDEEMAVSDPVSGITMRLTYRKEFHRTRLAFDVLWGVGLIRPELACRIAG